MPHLEGNWPTRNLVIQPCQCFWLCAVFGFRRKSTGARLVRTVYFEIPRKHGKALDIDTPIPTPEGFTRMGDLHVGDSVFAPDGSVTTVVAETEVQIGRPCYEVEFSSGEKIVADAEHEWVTSPRHFGPRAGIKGNRDFEGPDRIYTTKEIAETLTYGGRGDFNHRVAVAKAIDLPPVHYTVAPYVLGVWLGDGNSGTAQITMKEEEIRSSLEAYGEAVTPSNQKYNKYMYIQCIKCCKHIYNM